MRKLFAAAAVIVCLAVVAFAAPGAGEVQPAAKKPDWREIKPRTEFLARRLNPKDANVYEFLATDLLVEFGREGGAMVSYDATDIANVPKLSVTGVRTVADCRLFDLCQHALAQNNLTLMGTGERAFSVVGPGRTAEMAPAVDPKIASTLAPTEWVTVMVQLKGGNARKLIPGIRQVMTLVGGALIASDDGMTLVIVDVAGNIPRVLEMINAVDRDVVREPVVNYQRRTAAYVETLVGTLNRFLTRYASARGLPDNYDLTWDSNSQVVVGQVPQELAAFLDAAIDAASVAEKQRADAKEADERNFVTVDFTIAAEPGVAQVESGLRALFTPEANSGDARFVIKDRDAGTMVVRCRTWLEQGVRDAVKTLSSK